MAEVTSRRLVFLIDKMIIRNSSLNKEILAIAVPAIVSNITTPLLGLVDTAIVGHIGAAAYIAAIALGASIFNMEIGRAHV